MNSESKTIVITGASDGIGAAAAQNLANRGHQVVIVGRSPGKTTTLADQLGAPHFIADFADLRQVRDLAAQLQDRYRQIDVLANNAGGIMAQRELTVDGHEKTFQVNHLAPFLLTTLLMDTLIASGACIINTSSQAAQVFGRLDLHDLDAERTYSPNKAYGDAKLANILFTTELHRRYGDQGVSAAAFHPGVVASRFSTGSSSWLRFLYETPLRRFMLSPEQGADTLVWLATTRPGIDWTSGQYFVKRTAKNPGRQGSDPELARALWNRSAELVTGEAVLVSR